MKLNQQEAAAYRALLEAIHEINHQIGFLKRRGIKCQVIESDANQSYYLRATATILPSHTTGTLPLEDEPSNESDL